MSKILPSSIFSPEYDKSYNFANLSCKYFFQSVKMTVKSKCTRSVLSFIFFMEIVMSKYISRSINIYFVITTKSVLIIRVYKSIPNEKVNTINIKFSKF